MQEPPKPIEDPIENYTGPGSRRSAVKDPKEAIVERFLPFEDKEEGLEYVVLDNIAFVSYPDDHLINFNSKRKERLLTLFITYMRFSEEVPHLKVHTIRFITHRKNNTPLPFESLNLKFLIEYAYKKNIRFEESNYLPNPFAEGKPGSSLDYII